MRIKKEWFLNKYSVCFVTSQSFAFHSKVIWSEVKKVMDTMKILTDESFLYEDNV